MKIVNLSMPKTCILHKITCNLWHVLCVGLLREADTSLWTKQSCLKFMIWQKHIGHWNLNEA